MSRSRDASPHHAPSQASSTVVAPGWGAGGGEDELDPDGSARRALEIAVDRTGLYRSIEAAHGDEDGDDGRRLEGLEGHLASVIKFRGGPITLAEYMQEALTHPEFGYYMKRDVFGVGGDFITSPEISQVFGELLGVWAISTWQQMGKPANLRLVELGPGRGTLMGDLLRGTGRFKEFTAATTVHLVEVSPELRKIQRETLKCTDSAATGGKVYDTDEVGKMLASIRVAPNPLTSGGEKVENMDRGGQSSGGSTPEDLGWTHVDRGVSGLNGRPVEWHESLEAVPAGPTIFIAHEFFDAMPVHQFTRTERGWCEKLVALRGQAPRPASSDADDKRGDEAATQDATGGKGGDAPALELVLSPGLTPAAALLIPKRLQGMTEDQRSSLRSLEISPRTLAIWERIAARLEQHGGAAIAIDYGNEGPLGNTLFAIKQHKFCDLLTAPGTADLSAYVDFGAMRQVIENRDVTPGATYSGVECFGPVTQQELLISLGIGTRLEALIDACKTQEEADRLIEGCTRLVSGDATPGEGAGSGYEVSEGDNGEEEDRPSPPGMGIRYKAIAMVSKGLGVPVGFQRVD